MTKINNWQQEHDEHNILWLTIDRKGSSSNALNEQVLKEFEHIIDSLTSDTKTTGLVIQSGKSSGFIVGADLKDLFPKEDVKDPFAAIKSVVELGQSIYSKLANLKIPTVALVKGFCLGGGLELALACRYRIAVDDPDTAFAFPEVLVGLLPGWGGTTRLPRLVSPFSALDMMLTGRNIRAYNAKQMGLADECVPEREAHRAAVNYILTQPKPRVLPWYYRLLNQSWCKPLIAAQIRRMTAKKISEKHYPGPFLIIETWQAHTGNETEDLKREANAFVKLTGSKTSPELLRLFFLRDRLKSFSKQSDVEVKHVHVVGAGVMGGDIAAWCALRGFRVTLQDREEKFIAPAIARAAQLYKDKLKQPRLVTAALDRLIPDVAGHGLAKADVIIEAIYENLEAKQALFSQAEAVAKPTAILATNTSTIPLSEISSVMQNPKRLVGIHFFNPVAKMDLVEVVTDKQTSQHEAEAAATFVGQIGKLALPVKSSPGFLVNRILMPYFDESLKLLEEGVPGPSIDKAVTNFGTMMGPIQLLDTVGLDVALAASTSLAQHLGGEIPAILKSKVEKGELGRKTGHGFYHYKNGKFVPDGAKTSSPLSESEIVDRVIGRMIQESQACLKENVVEDSDLLDAAMVFGTGFAPFRGGPMQYLAAKSEDPPKH